VYVDRSIFLDSDPVADMATFYLLSSMFAMPSASTEVQVLADEAATMRSELVAKLDGLFTTYVAMAVGGELRHHMGVGQLACLSSSRRSAGGYFLGMIDKYGPSIVKDAADIFDDGTWSSGFGGAKWAAAAKILHARMTNKLPAWTFVDRVFSMQHNGGSLLNKVEWGTYGSLAFGPEGCVHIGNAHAAESPNFPMLMLAASDEATSLFKAFHKAQNRDRRGYAPMEVMPSIRDAMIRRTSSYYKLDAAGNYVINEAGDYVLEDAYEIMGNIPGYGTVALRTADERIVR
jgi:hypothetical protein